MPKWLKNWMIGLITCSEATDWISRAEEKRLSPSQWVKLRLHFVICIYCKLFYRQNKLITAGARHAAHSHATDGLATEGLALEELTAEEKRAMEERLKGLSL